MTPLPARARRLVPAAPMKSEERSVDEKRTPPCLEERIRRDRTIEGLPSRRVVRFVHPRRPRHDHDLLGDLGVAPRNGERPVARSVDELPVRSDKKRR